MASVRRHEFEKFRFFDKSPSRDTNLHLHTKFDRNQIIHGWDMEINYFQNGGRPPFFLEFSKIAVLVNWPISTCDSPSPFQFRINRPIWGRDITKKTIFNMASVCHLELEKNKSIVKFPSSGWKVAPAYQIWSISDSSRLIYEGKAIFKMAVVRHLEFAKFRFFFVKWSSWQLQSTSAYQICSKWDNSVKISIFGHVTSICMWFVISIPNFTSVGQ